MKTDSAQYYDLIYSFKDYDREADEIIRILEGQNSECQTILDVGCGTHELVKGLTKRFKVDGIDLCDVSISIAEEKNPDGNYSVGDMRSFDLGRQYDALICLSSSIGYLADYEDLVKTAECFSKHIKLGGLLVIEPWYFPETWKAGKVAMVKGGDQDVKIARASTRVSRGTDSVVTFHFMVAQNNRVEYFVEEHHLKLFSKRQINEAFENVGFNMAHSFDWSRGRGLFVGKLEH